MSAAPARAARVAIALAVAAAALAVAPRALAYFSATWFEDAAGFERALVQQRVNHAPMLVYFRTDWCPYCRAFDQRLEDYEMRSKLGAVVKARINPEHGAAERKLFEERFGGRGFPAIYWVPDGGTPRRLSAGKTVAEFLEQIADDLGGSGLNQTLRGDVLEPERLGDAPVRDLAVVDVDRAS